MDWGDAAAWLTGGLRGFLVLWAFALGASLGSFLNVVVYRLPAGLNLSRPDSRCPRCLTPIRRRDNVPVFGWLRLRGRCRACGLPIAKRYPLVEAVCGALLAALAVETVLLGGANLPAAGDLPGSGGWARSSEPALIAACGFQFAGQFFLIGAGLIAFDGHRVPAKLWAAGAALAVGGSSLWSWLRFGGAGLWDVPGGLAGAVGRGDLGVDPNAAAAADAAVAGGVTAAAALFTLIPTVAAAAGLSRAWNVPIVAGLAGSFFGPAGAWGLTAGALAWLATPALFVLTSWRVRVPGAVWLAAGAAAVPLVWRWLPDGGFGVGRWNAFGVWALAAAAAAVVNHAFFGDAAFGADRPAGGNAATPPAQSNSGTRVIAAEPPKQTATSDPGDASRSG